MTGREEDSAVEAIEHVDLCGYAVCVFLVEILDGELKVIGDATLELLEKVLLVFF